MKKRLLLDRKEIEGQNILHHIFGEGKINLVIEMGLGAVTDAGISFLFVTIHSVSGRK